MRCIVPGGLVDDAGTVHGEVELRALSGREEELLTGAAASESASLVTAILSRCVQRIGHSPTSTRPSCAGYWWPIGSSSS